MAHQHTTSAATRVIAALALGALVWLGAPGAADAHGIWGHIHVTGWAVENLPEGELKAMFQDPDVMNAALFGAAFTDSGYWPQGGELGAKAREYGEHTHWEPFIADAVAWIQANDPPPWTTKASKMRVAFIMGCASHGLQDEIFDSLFLYQIGEHDDAGQEEADPATDGFLALEDRVRFMPETYIPMDMLLELYADLNQPITEDVIQRSVETMTTFYVNDQGGVGVAESFGRQYEGVLTWTRTHYLDPNIPGSLVAEIMPTAHYMQAIWRRMHGDFTPDEAVVFAYPATPRRLLGTDAGSPDSWVTLIFGAGIDYEVINPTWNRDDDASTDPVAFGLRNTRWGERWTRLVRLQPSADLAPGAWYAVTLPAGVERIDGVTLASPNTHRFQAPCDADSPPDLCPDLGELFVPNIDPPEDADAGADAPEDAEAHDAEADSDDADSGDADLWWCEVTCVQDVHNDRDTTAQPDAPEDAPDDTPPNTDGDGSADAATGDDDGTCGCVTLPAKNAPSPPLGWGGLVLGLIWAARRARRRT